MNFQHLLGAPDASPIRSVLVGAGEFGVSFVSQCAGIDGLDVAVVCDRDLDRAKSAYERIGIDPGEIVVGDTKERVKLGVDNGRAVVVEDISLIGDCSLDIVVEATGNAEAAVSNALFAIDAGLHVAMVSKEAESVVGPYLHAKAVQAGVVYTPVDGDQPSLLIGLLSWATALGLEVVTAGKSSEYDFVYDVDGATITWTDRQITVPDFAELWQLDLEHIGQTIDARAEALAALPQRTVPDLCEMGVVANATGLRPDVPGFHVPVARTIEIPDVFKLVEDGGVIFRPGVIDVFNCLRRPDEASFAGGVFVVVRCHDRGTWQVLAGKGHPVSSDGGYAMLYNPQHLLGVEAPISVLMACRQGVGTGASMPQATTDLVAVAERDWRAGETLAITNAHHHEVSGLEPMLIPAGPCVPERPLPYYMLAGQRLRCDVSAGTTIVRDMVEAPTDSILWQTRERHDEHFF